MKRNRLTMGPLVGVVLACLAAVYAQAPEPTRSIVNISGDVYWAQDNNHYTVFLVTPEGIILGDPINTGFSAWLKGELERQFRVPVRYVLYSHHHGDHASGGAVFADSAQFVGHQNMIKRLALPVADTPLPGNVRTMDSNGNGRIEQGKADGALLNGFALIDANGDGALSGAEIVRGPVSEVRAPDLTFADRKTITLGGKSVEMIYTGIISHTDDMSVLYLEDDGVVFVCDFISIKRLPFRTLGNDRLDAWLNSIRTVEMLDFDTVLPAHGKVGSKADLTAHRHYIEELRDSVAEGIAAGRTLEQLQQSVLLASYKDWLNYDTQRIQNIEGMYNLVINE
jgi:glyoxylase-like metal-dependent hydrolase (beta-lactamase superfamily II)